MSTQKERPILMSSPMVCAILEGRKTQTRRIIKDQPSGSSTWIYHEESGSFYPNNLVANRPFITCPYGQPGDRLWVRETWQLFFDDEIPPDRFRGPRGTMGIPAQPERLSFAFYRADGDLLNPEFGKAHWMSPLYMPRKYSRITMEITNVRVERVQEISEDDAKAEGAERMHLDDLGQSFKSYKRGFQSIWESLHGPDSWDANPWVWIIEFKRLEARA